MIHRIRHFAFLLFGLLLAWTSYPAAAHDPKAAPLPPYGDAYTPQSVDERGLWMELDEEERKIRDSRFVIADPELTAYVRSVLCRTVGDERCRNVRLYVLRVAQFNAQMAPNGMMLVWSGLLLRVQNEAELGAVLGHEFAHFELRHSLKGFQQKRGVTDIQMWARILLPDNETIQTDLEGSMFAFSREQEKQADLQGLKYLASSSYPSAAAANIWTRLMAEQDATAQGRKRKIKHSYKAGFFADHPSDLARASYLREEAAKVGDEGDVREAAYRAGIAKWLPVFLDDQIKLNDFGGTEYLLKTLAGDNWTPELLYARAELYRRRGNPRDLVSAAQFYEEAVSKGCSNPEVYRGLGLALMRTRQIEPGREALRRYLSLDPNAKDAPMISALLAD
jgi:hypothetical protein